MADETQETRELEPCPFHEPEVNGPTEVVGEWYPGQRIAFWAAHCEACSARGPEESTRAEAVEAWNTRALTDEVTRLREALDAIVIRCRDGNREADWLPVIQNIARRALQPKAEGNEE
jgi:hypothetical protein